MGTTAKFGIQTDADVSGIKTLQSELAKIPELLKAWSAEMSAFAPVVEKTFAAAGNAAKAGASQVGQKIAQEWIQTEAKSAEQIAAAATAAAQKEEQRAAANAAKSKGRTIAELQEQLNLQEKSKKEIVALRDKLASEVGETAKKLTQTLDGEEKKRLQNTQKELKSELAAVKEEAEKRGVENKKGDFDKRREFSAKGAVELGGIGVAIEGLNSVIEKSKEVVAAEHQLQVGTGLSGEALKKAGEDAEELGNKLGVSGDEAKSTMGKVSSYTHATGEELNKQTEAVIAYAQAHGKTAEMVAKKLASEAGRNEIFAESITNVGKAQDAANEPAIRAQLTQQKLEETFGELASTLLSGLAPVLTQLTPLIGTIGGLVGDVLAPALKIVSFILTPFIEGLTALKPILPELALAIGVLTIAFNAQAIATGILNAVMAVNPFVWIAAAVLLLIGGIVLLVKHWKEVVEWFEKAAQTVMNAGGALLSLLGITGKAEAATRKHTDSLKENKKSLEDIKKAEEEAAKATSDYTDELKKNQEEQDKSAKEGQDNAIAAIVDIERRLKTATGAEKTMLEHRLEQWKAYGKKQVADAEEIEDAKENASKEIGARVEKAQADTSKKKIAAQKKSAKEEADLWLQDQKDLIELGKYNELESKQLLLQAEVEHAKKLLAIANKSKADILHARAELYKAQKALAALSNGADQDAMLENFHKEQALLKDASAQKDAFDSEQQAKRLDRMKKEAEYVTGPFVNALTSTFHTIMKGVDSWTKKMAESDNLLESFFGNIAAGFISMVEQMIEKIIALEAILLVANLIPGFSAFVESLGTFSSLIPGHAAGTDNSPGGLHWVGERGPELMNVPRGAQVIPNHNLPQFATQQTDLSPVLHVLHQIHSGVNRSNDTFSRRPSPVLPVNDRLNGMLNAASTAETRRAV